MKTLAEGNKKIKTLGLPFRGEEKSPPFLSAKAGGSPISYLWRKNHPNYWNEYKKKNREHIDEYQNNYRKTYKNKIKLRKAIYQKSTKGKEKISNWQKSSKNYRIYRKYYRQSLKGKLSYKIYRHNRRLKEKGLTIRVVQLVYEDNIKKYGTLTCYLCELSIPFGKDHLEHKTPLSRGGTNEYNNLAIACQKCNCSKHSKTETEYRRFGGHR